ncbi:hypothetical protein LCGC14_1168410 [marine sediment metagenome]|uniref:Uncharacterized protein n=1 Tax=marine sediment metagenome TaxID=412755 RepID=A0A0F9P8P1_9ZZZZ
MLAYCKSIRHCITKNKTFKSINVSSKQLKEIKTDIPDNFNNHRLKKLVTYS